ncbi:hypothetical protein GCM10011533_37070 [Streptosporangium jomthongense]|uniref:Uncharacterized protein n=1 Tax=Marinobacter aromaticivorans TaxID=1494078 RepID=A0ABW2J0W2_9GAMM|nr:hypothetical protein [Marinobacter aromaticivorans]GGE81232.1 hypothetical protein GCM10011533_37070 [Streptosporangium jomthongense]
MRSTGLICYQLQYAPTAELNDDIRRIVLRGAGEHFLAGGDVKSFMAFTKLPPEERRLTFINRIHGLNTIMYGPLPFCKARPMISDSSQKCIRPLMSQALLAPRPR